MTHDPTVLPDDLPVPEDDGAADHLPGLAVPSIALSATSGSTVDLAERSRGRRLVVFAYPRTGRPGVPNPGGWDEIPGARGCTPEACGFRDHVAEFGALGATLLGVSSQSPEDQDEFAAREHIPYPLLSDEGLVLVPSVLLVIVAALVANSDRLLSGF